MTLEEHAERVHRAAEAVLETKRPADRRVRMQRFLRLYVAFGEAVEGAEAWLHEHFGETGDDDVWIGGLRRYEAARTALTSLERSRIWQ